MQHVLSRCSAGSKSAIPQMHFDTSPSSVLLFNAYLLDLPFPSLLDHYEVETCRNGQPDNFSEQVSVRCQIRVRCPTNWNPLSEELEFVAHRTTIRCREN